MSLSPTCKAAEARHRAVALMITLAMLAIASIVLVAFVTSVRIDRVATFSYSQSLKTDQLARGALQLVVSQLQQEMAKDAPPDTGGGAWPQRPVYTNLTATNVAPQLSGTNSAMPLLLKASATNYPFAGTSLTGNVTATPIGSTAASLNGRSVPLSRWNQACLGTFPSAASAPAWVLVTRSGATNGAGIAFGATGGTLNNPAASNTNCVVGRFAYAVYDVGGLLDVNVAGHPSLTAAQLQQIKGTLAGADLSAVGIASPSQLVSWRNASNGASAAAYLGYVTNFAATNSFLGVAPGDTAFLGRQDLIAAAQAGVAGLTPAALTNLTVFSRDLDVPSWGPAADAPAGGRYRYASNANVSNAAPFSIVSPNPNRYLPMVRFTGSGTLTTYRNDGVTPVSIPYQPGDPVTMHRFPLGRLAWITAIGPKAGVPAKAIQDCFGLVWDLSTDPALAGVKVWKYAGPSGTAEQASIATLDQVAAAGREPNFFELLQAGILNGSLGVDGGGSQDFLSTTQKYPMLQILRIGASIIDQADSDAMPTAIEFLPLAGATVPWRAVGVESLPYLQTVVPVCGAPPENPSSTTAMAVYLLFSLWNPHQASAAGAPAVRLHIQGGLAIHSNCGNYAGTMIQSLPGYSVTVGDQLALNAAASANYSDARLLSAADAATTLNAGSPSAGGWATTPPAMNAYFKVNPAPSGGYAAYRLPDLPLDFTSPQAQALTVSGGSWVIYYSYPNPATNPFMAWIEYWNGTAWIPYQYFNGVNDPATWGGTSTLAQQSGMKMTGLPPTAPPQWFGAANTIKTVVGFFGNDPRSSRFGPWQFNPVATAPSVVDSPMLWTPRDTAYAASGYGGVVSGAAVQVPPTGLGGTFTANYFPATLARNNGAPKSTTLSAYLDTDGVQRWGDSGFWPSSTGSATGNPFNLAATRIADRPQVLDRPFASVAELGYALRDQPWRSLDFSTANSADAALLDLFTVGEVNTNAVAGRISLNGQNVAALAAVLTDAIVADSSGSPATSPTTITSDNATLIAQALVASTAGQALTGKDQLATRFAANLAAGFADADSQNVKARREAVVRALADVGQTRTWNLMIDLVAQSGIYPPTATSLGQFVVTGERRYWLHVAIDRITGRVIDTRLEAVSL